jgi:hypothetical protein
VVGEPGDGGAPGEDQRREEPGETHGEDFKPPFRASLGYGGLRTSRCRAKWSCKAGSA